MTNVVVVNYGMGNIKSVMRGVEKVGEIGRAHVRTPVTS